MGHTVHGSVASMGKLLAITSRPTPGCTQFPIQVPGALSLGWPLLRMSRAVHILLPYVIMTQTGTLLLLLIFHIAESSACCCCIH